jgi:integrase
VKRPGMERTEVAHLSPGDVTALLRAAQPSRYYSALVLVALTLLRRGEALALRWDRVDLDRGVLEVAATPHWARSKPPACTTPTGSMSCWWGCARRPRGSSLAALGSHDTRDRLVPSSSDKLHCGLAADLAAGAKSAFR